MVNAVDSGGGGSVVGATSYLIAAAAAKAELTHHNWEETGDWTVKREIVGFNPYVAEYATVEVNTLSGAYTSESAGALGESSVGILVAEANETIAKWGPKIEDLFTKWKPLPSSYTPSAQLDWAAAELNIDPDDPQSTGDSFGQVNSRLAGDLESIKTRTSQLKGQYAETFADYYVNQLPTTFQSQGRLVSALAVACRAQGEIWSRTADDLASFEQDALAAMKSAGDHGGPDGDLVLGLTVVGAFISAISAVPTLGGSAALFGAIAGGAVSIGAGVESAKTADTSFQDLPLGAEDPDGVFKNMEAWLKALDEQIQVQETGVRDFLTAAKAFADGGACELSRPSLDSAPPKQVLSDKQPIIVSNDLIAKITELWLPSVAADLRQAEGYLTVTADEGFTRSTDIGLAPNGAWTQFSALQTRASALMTGLSRDLEDAGAKLERAAELIGKTDDDTSRRYRRIENTVENRNLNDVDDVVPLL